ncbi:MAG: FAD:protein FMN transferase [Bacteroidales bacterium]|jgi:thiamine biosynthesis lipoprotein|nr:FAD:protein FMN transferase [Bacteroidales bacterium]
MLKVKIFLGLTLLAILAVSCSQNAECIKYSGPTQGTMFNITYCSDINYNKEIDSLLINFSRSLSNYDSTSLISRINHNETDSLDALAEEFFKVSKEVWENTGGIFDVSVAPIVNAWGFGWVRHEKHIPDSTEINNLLQHVGLDKIDISNGKITKHDNDVQIITNAIAQGLSVDYVSDFFKSKGVNNFLVEIGGEIYCSGKNAKGKNWKIGVDKPIEGSGYEYRENQIVIQLSDMAVNTSGNYRKFLEEGEKKYGHSINPTTGYPAENEMISATVVYPDCIRADAYATAFMVMGAEKAMKIVESIDGMEAYFIVHDGEETKTIESKGFGKFYE